MRSDIRGQTAVRRCAPYSERLRGRTTTKTQSSVLSPQSSERGSTLVISLIMLIILMLLGVMAINTSDTQYKLAGNLQFEDLAMNNAEVAIAAAESWLEADVAARKLVAPATGTALVPSAAPPGIDPLTIDPLTMTWTNADSVPVVPGDDRQRYVIGFVSTNRVPTAGVGACPDANRPYDCVNTYLITARGQGGRGATKLVQVYYSVPH